jgi:hypothetical protein
LEELQRDDTCCECSSGRARVRFGAEKVLRVNGNDSETRDGKTSRDSAPAAALSRLCPSSGILAAPWRLPKDQSTAQCYTREESHVRYRTC